MVVMRFFMVVLLPAGRPATVRFRARYRTPLESESAAPTIRTTALQDAYRGQQESHIGLR